MLLLKNGRRLVKGHLEPVEILIDGDKILAMDKELNASADQTFDLKSKLLAPGFIDVHVHWREPGFEYKENIYHASRAAARGGFTTAMPMPNLNPVPDSYDHLKPQ